MYLSRNTRKINAMPVTRIMARIGILKRIANKRDWHEKTIPSGG
jgi:hypothetical protein